MIYLCSLVILSCLVGVGISDAEGVTHTSNTSQPGTEISFDSTVAAVTESISSNATEKSKSSCFSSEKERIECCNKRVESFKSKWFIGSKYLQTFFQELEKLKCTQLKKICEEKVYAKFSEYSRLVVAFYCARDEFEDECLPVITSLQKLPNNTSWNDAVRNMTSSQYSTEELLKPCVQVGIYESVSGGYGYYHEIVDTYIPFCDISWCGFDLKTLEKRKISSWSCMPSRCRTNLIIVSVVCALLATAIILSNITVIIVFTTSPKLRNSQAVYKISLAIADLLVGAVVLPTFVSTLMILYRGQAEMGGILSKDSPNSEGTIPRKSGGFDRRLSSEYLNFVGFFTMLSLMVSIYTLMTASFDRFMAIYQPLTYGHHNAKRMAIWCSLGLWVLAIFFSAMPLFVPAMAYGLAASIMVASLETAGLILYAVVVLLPLILVWIMTIATYNATRTHARVRQSMRVRRGSGAPGKKKNTKSVEARLARTLASMVGVFTLCLLPAAVVLIVPHTINDIYPKSPDVFDPTSHKAFISAEFVTILILMTNSLWNCFIYNSRSDDFKKTAKRLYAKLLRILGLNAVWKKTRGFATTTMRLRRSTLTTSLLSLNSSLRSGAYRKKSEGETSRTADDANARKASESSAAVNVYRYTQDKGKMESEFGAATVSGNFEATPDHLDAVFENEPEGTT